jgi:hypothetical protein
MERLTADDLRRRFISNLRVKQTDDLKKTIQEMDGLGLNPAKISSWSESIEAIGKHTFRARGITLTLSDKITINATEYVGMFIGESGIHLSAMDQQEYEAFEPKFQQGGGKRSASQGEDSIKKRLLTESTVYGKGKGKGKGNGKGKGKGKGQTEDGHCYTWENTGQCWKHDQGTCRWKHENDYQGINVRTHKRNYEINNMLYNRHREAIQEQERTTCTPINPGEETAMEDSEQGNKTKRAIRSKAHKTSNQLKYLTRPPPKKCILFSIKYTENPRKKQQKTITHTKSDHQKKKIK